MAMDWDDLFGTRPDGSKKGPGYLGPIKTEDGKQTITELSIGLPIRQKDGSYIEMDVPTMVPTLTRQELDFLRANSENLPRPGNPVMDSIARKAAEHAEQRISEGHSPFIEHGQRARRVGLIEESYKLNKGKNYGRRNDARGR
jgi:hypothetical protein